MFPQLFSGSASSPRKSVAIARNCSRAASRSSTISCARISGPGRLPDSLRLSSFSQKMSRLGLSRLMLRIHVSSREDEKKTSLSPLFSFLRPTPFLPPKSPISGLTLSSYFPVPPSSSSLTGPALIVTRTLLIMLARKFPIDSTLLLQAPQYCSESKSAWRSPCTMS